MNQRAQAWWRRHAALLAAVLLHVGLLWLILPYMINPTEPLPSDSVDVAMVPPAHLPKPKPIRVTPAPRPAEKNASAARPYLKPAPRLAHVVQPPLRLPLPPPLVPKPPMSLAAVPGPPAPGGPASGSGGTGGGAGGGNGNGDGGREGIDYLIRLKAYIDAHKNGDRHREPNDADLVLVLDPDGRLTDLRVVSSSGDPSVDDEIMTQLKGMSPFPKPPAILFSPSKPLLPVADKWIFPRP
jgi:TonB family protein